MEISAIAKECGNLEDELEIVAREVHELRAQKSRAMRPSSLASMVHGRLSMPSARLTFHVTEEDMKRKLGSRLHLASNQRFKSAGEFAGTR
jgi:DNA repair ATPase RecN